MIRVKKLEMFNPSVEAFGNPWHSFNPSVEAFGGHWHSFNPSVEVSGGIMSIWPDRVGDSCWWNTSYVICITSLSLASQQPHDKYNGTYTLEVPYTN